MDIRKKLNDFRELISENNITEALSEMRQLLLDNSELKNDSILLSSQLNGIKKRIQLRLIDYGEYAQIESRIVSAFLEILNEFEKSQLDKNPNHIPDNKDNLNELLELLDMTYQAFKAQALIRNKLHDRITKRLKVNALLEYEDFFNEYFDEMTDNERLLHATIRGYTDTVLSEYNFRILDILKFNPSLKEVLPRLKELERHLVIWRSKYQRVFKLQPSMCLVYVGVEEESGFPKGIESEIRGYLETL